ncbi:MAG: hypothetical protein ACP5II_03590 [Infirmifilum sp.]|uniref:hypothetical protein n=1 Tax=Infirmifilum TaxID=2856573 RepID=UPI003C794872
MSELFDSYESALSGKKRRGSLSISGAGKANGGYYQEIKISGAGKVEGDVESERVSVAGSAVFSGNVVAVEAKLAGAVKVLGSLKAKRVSSAGALKVMGCLEAEEALLTGGISIGCLTFTFARIEGGIRILGKTEGEHLVLNLSDESKVGEVSVKKLEVKTAEKYGVVKLLKLLSGGDVPVLEASKIDAEEVTIYNVTVKAPVRARRIILRGKARIEGEVQGEVIQEK